MTKAATRIRSIQFLPDRVVVDYGEHHVYQFCKACKDGKHVKNFLNDFCGESNLVGLIDEANAIRFERKFYHQLAYGPSRRIFGFEAAEFGAYVKRRCVAIVKRQQKALLKEEANVWQL